MKENPRMFFSYINKQRNRKNEIGPFKSGEEFIYDGKKYVKSQYLNFTHNLAKLVEKMEMKIDLITLTVMI